VLKRYHSFTYQPPEDQSLECIFCEIFLLQSLCPQPSRDIFFLRAQNFPPLSVARMYMENIVAGKRAKPTFTNGTAHIEGFLIKKRRWIERRFSILRVESLRIFLWPRF
jgi:hypothetical protein